MWEWSDKLKLGKSSSAFVKKEIRPLPLTEVEFEADFFLDPKSSSKRQGHWIGIVIERDYGGVLAMEDVRFPPPTVNSLATLLAHAMLRPLNAGDRQRPNTIHLRDRPQWSELLPHLRQLGIQVVLGDDLPRFDQLVVEWMQKATTFCQDEIRVALQRPFPERQRSEFTDAMELMEWSDAMFKGAYPSRKAPVPAYEPTTVVAIQLASAELEAILTKTRIAKMKELRPRLEAMAAQGTSIELDINDWSTVLLALCGAGAEDASVRKHLLGTATRVADLLADALGIAPPSL